MSISDFKIVALCSLLLVGMPYALANNKQGSALSVSEHKELTRIAQDLALGKSEVIERELLALTAKKHSAYAQALSWQMLASIRFKGQQWLQAKQYYEASLAGAVLPAKSRAKIYASLMQANYYLKDWQGSVDSWLLWNKQLAVVKQPALKADDYLRAVYSYQGLQKWQGAATALRGAIALTAEPPEQWLQLQWDIERRLNSASSQIALLKQLIEKLPQREIYWVELAQLYQKQGAVERATALLNSAFISGALGESANILWLANGLSQQGNPAAAANVLEQAIAKGLIVKDARSQQMLVHFYVMAKNPQQALRVLEQRSLTEVDFKERQQLAQLYFKMDQWQQAYDSGASIVDDAARHSVAVQLLLAMSSMNLQQSLKAETHFNSVLQLDPHNTLAERGLKALYRPRLYKIQ